jgi:hypothetical protein
MASTSPTTEELAILNLISKLRTAWSQQFDATSIAGNNMLGMLLAMRARDPKTDEAIPMPERAHDVPGPVWVDIFAPVGASVGQVLIVTALNALAKQICDDERRQCHYYDLLARG